MLNKELSLKVEMEEVVLALALEKMMRILVLTSQNM